MRVFISWSGQRSNKLALALHDWLPLVLHYVEPWLSKADIKAGDRWAQSVAKELSTANFGIVCVTSENVNAPWMLFESGALAKSLETSRVIPLLLDLEFSDISGPLAQFQAKKLTREGLNEIVQSLQSATEEPVPEERARQLFNALWPELEKKLTEIPGEVPPQRHTRPQSEVLEELVASIRALGGQVRQSSVLAVDLSSERRARRDSSIPLAALEDLAERSATSPADPIRILILATSLRETPWLYELALETYRAIRARRRDWQRTARHLMQGIEATISLREIMEMDIEPINLNFAHHTLGRFFDLRLSSQLKQEPLSHDESEN